MLTQDIREFPTWGHHAAIREGGVWVGAEEVGATEEHGLLLAKWALPWGTERKGSRTRI